MGLLDGFKTEKAIATILSSITPASMEAKQAASKLRRIGPPAIPKLIAAFAVAHDSSAIENLLVGFLNDTTLPSFIEALKQDNPHVVSGVAQVLIRSDRYDPNSLIRLFQNPDVPKNILGRILDAHVERLSQSELVGLLEKSDSNARPVIYQLLDKTAVEASIPLLVNQLNSQDAALRARLTKTLSRFSTEVTRSTLIGLLDDPDKKVRQAAMEGLAKLTIPVPSKVIMKLLRDPDVTVQGQAIETLAKLRDAATVKYLIDFLHDDSEYIRRAAVEVLNRVADQRAIKDLLGALRDKDWWVRVRAADALGSIGGPKIVDAVLALLTDEDEFIRRTAVEVLNTTKDDRATDYLINALGDQDWWVRERAADALAALGSVRAIGPLRKMLQQGPEASQIAIRALATIGDKEAIDLFVRELESENSAVRKEAFRALEKLTDEEHAEQVQIAMTQLLETRSDRLGEAKDLAASTLNALVSRFGNKTQIITTKKPATDTPTQAPANETDSAATPSGHISGIIDASKLTPGQILGDRYRIVKQVGKGGFGVVVLVEDLVVGDQFILKFLSPHFAADENSAQRFTHEIRYTRKITHQNVIRIYDFIAMGSSYAISMEYFPSHSLADELKGGAPVEISRGIGIARQIADGMGAAQSCQVVHRDLKPANILINDENLVKIVDFGLAAAASHNDSRITKSGLLIGSPTYMAPEQVRGRAIDARSDIYSLGVIMYEIFTGKPPYQGDDPMSILFQHVQGGAIPPKEVNPDIPDRLNRIILKALAMDPAQRYQTFAELRADLDALESS
jgi:HEAT repeat protein